MTTPSNQPLDKPLRSLLETAVKSARDVADKAARAALAQLAVADAKAPDYLATDELKALRRRLRAHGRALGDIKAKDDTQGVQHLVWEVAYEHWHRMLFARFLAENHLLLWEPGAPVTLAECDELAQDPSTALGARSGWELAGKLAARMLPQVFKTASPVFELTFAPEHQRELERLLGALSPEVFKASDSLGWVYQFWQAKRKDEVNASEVKIGADELSAVTQLFTEPYMVDFLLHNSLGAWWVTRHPGKPCPVPLSYLRSLEDGTPAAGKFEGWPDRLQDFTLLDPCCGSGHFLVAAFLLLVPMRMAAEGLSAMNAVDAVLADNLHGLELDARCVEIAVFALALAAWRFPDENGDPLGVRVDMPAPQVACCGLKVAAKPEDWMALVQDGAPNAVDLRQELRHMHASFAQAPLLGSLLDPTRSLGSGSLGLFDFEVVKSALEMALSAEHPTTLCGQASELQDDSWDLALTAKGLLDAARLLNVRYHLVVTNVPYLARTKQEDALKEYCSTHYPDAKNDLANVFLERCIELTVPDVGCAQVVMPQNWLFLSSYRKQRQSLLQNKTWALLGRLGFAAFDIMDWWAFGTILISIVNTKPNPATALRGVDTSSPRVTAEKAAMLRESAIAHVLQESLLRGPDSRVGLEDIGSHVLLQKHAVGLQGVSTSDNSRFRQHFWEQSKLGFGWSWFQGSTDETQVFGGCDSTVWMSKLNELYEAARDVQSGSGDFEDGRNASKDSGVYLRGQMAWGKKGVAIRQMRHLPASIYLGSAFDTNTAVIFPGDQTLLPAIWSLCSSPEFLESIRKVDQKLNVTNATMVKVPFDLDRWKEVAAEQYPNGLPKPYSNDPTQWLFHGHPQPATDPLQVAIARLAGYRWPAETDAAMELADEARTWIAHCVELAEYADDDGIVCLPSVRGEPGAHDRLLKLLIAAWETVQPGSWKPAVLDKLLAEADCAGKGLDVWLREKFFEQHAKRFHHRPFIWHVWDGLKDGFAALVNYHRLDAKKLERLIHTYLGDWIRQQEAGVRDRIDGAPTRLAAAQDLKRRLELILEGEFAGKVGYDIFVRWKPLAEQPIGWNPDLNDGVRLNIRPFMAAEVLRHNKKPKLNITWDKDRGKDVESAPWFKVFEGDRINDHHLSLADKRAALAKAGRS